jgi:hypothetical protein
MSAMTEARKVADRLDKLKLSVHGKAYKHAMSEAADTIRLLTRNPQKLAPEHEADTSEVRWHTEGPDGGEIQVVMLLGKEPKAYMIFKATGAYDLAQELLYCYDKLEGLS